MTRKGLYYCRINSQDPVNKGAVQKCHGLMTGFHSLGWDMDIVWYSGEGVLVNDEVIFPFPFSADSSDIRNIFFHHLRFDSVIAKYIDFCEYDFLFIRYPLAHPAFLFFLKNAKMINPNLRIFLEVPTYPYDSEFSSPLRKMQYWLDRFCSRFLKRNVNTTVHYGKFEQLFGIPSIGISNGIDVQKYPTADTVPNNGVLRLLAVGNWNYWHGLDRLLMGLNKYYESLNNFVKVELTIVGGGRELYSYQKLVKENCLEPYVKFIPPIEGSELDMLYNYADICVGCLGIHRKNVVIDSSLKHREYAVRGIPFILSTPDIDFPSTLPWVFYCPKDDSAIKINDLLNFHHKNLNLTMINREIRKYAEDNLDWSQKLKFIFS